MSTRRASQPPSGGGRRGARARAILANGNSPLGGPLLESYGDAGTQSTGSYWLILAAFAAFFFIATWAVLVRTTRAAR